jgi:putative protein kinase ArgK-like GTPase of G3E family
MGSVESTPKLTRVERIHTVIKKNDAKLVLFRGMPGAGKSTLVQEFLQSLPMEERTKVVVASADDYFQKPSGAYEFDKTKLQIAHHACQQTARDGLNNGSLVLVDNTNMRTRDVQVYLEMADRKVVYIDLQPPSVAQANVCASRGTHASSHAAMQMFATYESLPIPGIKCFT